MRAGAEYFLHPAGASQRRYEALRAYFTEDMPAAEVADRFGYSTASVHQMATLLRRAGWPCSPIPGPAPKGRARPPASCAPGCWRCGRPGTSVTEIADALTADGPAGVGADGLADPGRRGDTPAAPPR